VASIVITTDWTRGMRRYDGQEIREDGYVFLSKTVDITVADLIPCGELKDVGAKSFLVQNQALLK